MRKMMIPRPSPSALPSQALPFESVTVRMWTLASDRYFFAIYSSPAVPSDGPPQGEKKLCLVAGQCLERERVEEDSLEAVLALDRRAWALRAKL
jgi:hypothetical protein